MKNVNYENFHTRFRPEIFELWTTNHIDENTFDCLMKVVLHFLILKHAMVICYIFLSSNGYLKEK